MSWSFGSFSLMPCALFCAVVLYSGFFIYLAQAQPLPQQQQQEVPIELNADELPTVLNTNFGAWDINDIASGSISDISVNALLPQRVDLLSAAGNPETPQPTLLMRMNMNSGL